MSKYMKTCRDCKETKDLDQFNKKKDGYLGRQTRCRPCNQAYSNQHRKENPDLYQQWDKKKYEKDKERIKARQRQYTKDNKEVISLKNKARYYERRAEYLTQKKEYYRENSDKVKARVSLRRGYKQDATPSWLSEEDIQCMEDIFTFCKVISEESGELHHVDHIIPLKAKDVCGLNVPWNLQVLTAKENLSKGNRIEDDDL